MHNVAWLPMFTEGAVILLQTGTAYVNHTLIFTPGAFKFSNHYSIYLESHWSCSQSNICHIKTIELPDPPFCVLVMQYI